MRRVWESLGAGWIVLQATSNLIIECAFRPTHSAEHGYLRARPIESCQTLLRPHRTGCPTEVVPESSSCQGVWIPKLGHINHDEEHCWSLKGVGERRRGSALIPCEWIWQVFSTHLHAPCSHVRLAKPAARLAVANQPSGSIKLLKSSPSRRPLLDPMPQF